MEIVFGWALGSDGAVGAQGDLELFGRHPHGHHVVRVHLEHGHTVRLERGRHLAGEDAGKEDDSELGYGDSDADGLLSGEA